MALPGVRETFGDAKVRCDGDTGKTAGRTVTRVERTGGQVENLPCHGGPLDGSDVNPARGDWFQPVSGTGLYVRQGTRYLWRPHTIRNMRQPSDNLPDWSEESP